MRPIAFLIRVGAVVAVLAVGFSLLDRDEPLQAVGAREALQAREAERKAELERKRQEARAAAFAARRQARVEGRAAQALVTIAAVGDIVMGSTPNLPPGGGRGFFDDVQSELAADIVLGNLEGTLTTASGSKCGPDSSNCYAFRTPPSYVRWLKQAGFTILNLANNHAYDFGEAGLRETVRTLRGAGLLHTGRPGQIAYQQVGDARVAILGFASYRWAQSLTDIPAAMRLVRRADAKADLVVVTFHGGAEGASKQRVARGTETYLGENRGDLIRFSRAVVDAGADVVIGHGPHVLRGMEWYKGRLIAYSLGNFAGYKVFALGGPLSVSAILRLTLRGDGRFESGILVPTRLVGNGVPALDPAEEAHGLVRSLSKADFGSRAVTITRTGVLGR
jgi:poly-gamma-glutamate capsule biosynthesis protein CapA/YwtB (metallophosphatase superfamily)